MFTRRSTRGARGPVVAAAVAAAVLALAACESDSPPDSSGKNSSAQAGTGAEAGGGNSVVAPGKPGEPAKTLSPEEVEKALPDDSPNDADIAYAHRMIEHHRQALTMTDLTAERAASPKVKRLAERISAAQKPEIGAMEGWLDSHGEKATKGGGGHGGHGGHGDHGGDGMPGMATEAQLKQLRAARGAAFDELFLKLMITHHHGAITMATEALTNGNNVRVEEMAGDVVASQTVEINRMRNL